MTGIILPSDAAKQELRSLGLHVEDPAEHEAAYKAYTAEVTRLARAVAAPLCGMTSRPPDRRFECVVEWVTGLPLPATRRVASYELAIECGLWAEWVLMPAMPKPPPRPFIGACWPDVGHGPPPGKPKRKARRS